MIDTNPIGLLYVEIDSTGSLKMTGDRVIVGNSGRLKKDSEWVVRQQVARARGQIAAIVHAHGGIVVRAEGDRLLANLPDAERTAAAAGEIHLAHSDPDMEQALQQEGTIVATVDVRVAVGFGSVAVDVGRLGGDALDRTRALLNQADDEHVLASAEFVAALGEAEGIATHPAGHAKTGASGEDFEVWALQWTGIAGRVGAAPNMGPGKRNGSGLPDETASGPTLRLRVQGKEVTLDPEHPTLMLRSGREKVEHARLEYRDGGFYLENLNVSGTRLRRADGAELVCLDVAELSGTGALSLGVDFSQPAAVIEFSVEP